MPGRVHSWLGLPYGALRAPARLATATDSLPEIDLNDMSEFPTKGARPIWIASYPRSGNTFLRIILEKVFQLPSYSLYYVEGDSHRDPSSDALEEAPMLPPNWRELLVPDQKLPIVAIKTHGPPTDDAPAIFIARDGRAAIDSYYHYHKKFAFEQPSLTEVIAGACQFGSWSAHYWAWRPKSRARTLLLQYEDLVSRPQEVIPRLSEFLDLPPQAASLPHFEELQRRSPAFFRRGQNMDYVKEWSALHMALFNQLHAPAMKDLGFSLVAPDESAVGALNELAQSAARLHQMYLEQLSNVGRAMLNHDQDVQRLSREIQELSRQIQQVYKPFLATRWVRLGIALGAIPREPSDEVLALPPLAQPAKDQPAGSRVKSSDGNSRSFSPGLRTGAPSVPSEGTSARG